MKESIKEKLQEIVIDQTLSFKQHFKTLCWNASQQLHTLARISCYIDTFKLKQLMHLILATVPLFGCSMKER